MLSYPNIDRFSQDINFRKLQQCLMVTHKEQVCVCLYVRESVCVRGGGVVSVWFEITNFNQFDD